MAWCCLIFTLNFIINLKYFFCGIFLTEDSITTVNDDIDKILQFLQELCKGEVLRSVICDVIVQQCQDLTQSNADITYVDSETSLCQSPQDCTTTVCYQDYVNCCEKEPVNYLELLLDIVIKLDFPEKLVTFLLQLLPNQQYKVCLIHNLCSSFHIFFSIWFR